MTGKRVTLAVLALILLLLVAGCSSPATPTKPAPTVAPPVVTVVITATPPAAPPTQAVPTITPIPTLALTTTVAASTPVAVKATNTAGAPKATATKKPTAGPVPPTATVPVALKYGAPKLIGPVYDEAMGRKDERHYPADALVFQWMSVGNLSGNECYVVRVDFNPGQGDSFLQCNADQATQLGVGATASFTLYQPNRGGPNYSALLPNTAGSANVSWSVQVVRDDGKGNGPADANSVRHATTPLSPKRGVFTFLIKGQ